LTENQAALIYVNVNNINTSKEPPMTGVLQQLDNLPRPFVFVGMILGFILFWPIGLAVLAYMIWSKRMGCASGNNSDRYGHWAQRNQHMADRWQQKSQHFMDKMNRKMERWGARGAVFQPTGNVAFDEYREETLRRLEEEATEFNDFMARLRMARDKAEFDQYMSDRKAPIVPVAPDNKAQDQ
jgi:Protein of unknown function (DUF2852)